MKKQEGALIGRIETNSGEAIQNQQENHADFETGKEITVSLSTTQNKDILNKDQSGGRLVYILGSNQALTQPSDEALTKTLLDKSITQNVHLSNNSRQQQMAKNEKGLKSNQNDCTVTAQPKLGSQTSEQEKRAQLPQKVGSSQKDSVLLVIAQLGELGDEQLCAVTPIASCLDLSPERDREHKEGHKEGQKRLLNSVLYGRGRQSNINISTQVLSGSNRNKSSHESYALSRQSAKPLSQDYSSKVQPSIKAKAGQFNFKRDNAQSQPNKDYHQISDNIKQIVVQDLDLYKIGGKRVLGRHSALLYNESSNVARHAASQKGSILKVDRGSQSMTLARPNEINVDELVATEESRSKISSPLSIKIKQDSITERNALTLRPSSSELSEAALCPIAAGAMPSTSTDPWRRSPCQTQKGIVEKILVQVSSKENCGDEVLETTKQDNNQLVPPGSFLQGQSCDQNVRMFSGSCTEMFKNSNFKSGSKQRALVRNNNIPNMGGTVHLHIQNGQDDQSAKHITKQELLTQFLTSQKQSFYGQQQNGSRRTQQCKKPVSLIHQEKARLTQQIRNRTKPINSRQSTNINTPLSQKVSSFVRQRNQNPGNQILKTQVHHSPDSLSQDNLNSSENITRRLSSSPNMQGRITESYEKSRQRVKQSKEASHRSSLISSLVLSQKQSVVAGAEPVFLSKVHDIQKTRKSNLMASFEEEQIQLKKLLNPWSSVIGGQSQRYYRSKQAKINKEIQSSDPRISLDLAELGVSKVNITPDPNIVDSSETVSERADAYWQMLHTANQRVRTAPQNKVKPPGGGGFYGKPGSSFRRQLQAHKEKNMTSRVSQRFTIQSKCDQSLLSDYLLTGIVPEISEQQDRDECSNRSLLQPKSLKGRGEIYPKSSIVFDTSKQQRPRTNERSRRPMDRIKCSSDYDSISIDDFCKIINHQKTPQHERNTPLSKKSLDQIEILLRRQNSQNDSPSTAKLMSQEQLEHLHDSNLQKNPSSQKRQLSHAATATASSRTSRLIQILQAKRHAQRDEETRRGRNSRNCKTGNDINSSKSQQNYSSANCKGTSRLKIACGAKMGSIQHGSLIAENNNITLAAQTSTISEVKPLDDSHQVTLSPTAIQDSSQKTSAPLDIKLDSPQFEKQTKNPETKTRATMRRKKQDQTKDRLRVSDHVLLAIKKDERIMKRRLSPKWLSPRAIQRRSRQIALEQRSEVQVNLHCSPLPQKKAMPVTQYNFEHKLSSKEGKQLLLQQRQASSPNRSSTNRAPPTLTHSMLIKEKREVTDSTQMAHKHNCPVFSMPHSNSFQYELPRTRLSMNKVPEHCTQINVQLKKAEYVNCLTRNMMMQIPSILDDRSSLAGGNMRGDMRPKYSESRVGGGHDIINITSQGLNGGVRAGGEAATGYKTRHSGKNLSLLISRRFSEIEGKNLRDQVHQEIEFQQNQTQPASSLSKHKRNTMQKQARQSTVFECDKQVALFASDAHFASDAQLMSDRSDQPVTRTTITPRLPQFTEVKDQPTAKNLQDLARQDE